MKTYYVYDDNGANIKCVLAENLSDAVKEAMFVTGLGRNDLSIESA